DATWDVRSLAIDPCRLEGQAVCQRHVAVEPAYQYRIPGREGIDPRLAREGSATPTLVIPVSAENPLSGAAFGREILEACDEFGRRIGAPGIHARELVRPLEEGE